MAEKFKGGRKAARTILMADMFVSHAAIVDLMLDGLEDEVLASDKQHLLDRKVGKVVN
jgi:hypothetical protein